MQRGVVRRDGRDSALQPDVLRKVFGVQLLLISLHMIFAGHGN